MATVVWEPKAAPTIQVVTATVGGTLSGETFTISIGGVQIASHTDATTVIADTVAALVSQWNASTQPYAAAVTAADASPDITFTADTAGCPFGDESDSWKLTLNTPGGSATFTQAVTTAPTGPNFVDNAENWNTGSLPVNTDDAKLAGSDVNVCWGLAGLDAVTLASLTSHEPFTGMVGLNPHAFATSADGETVNTTVAEYRQTFLEVGADVVDLGITTGPATGDGSGRIRIKNNKAGASTTTVYGSASAATDTGQNAVYLHCAHASADIYIENVAGGVGIGTEPGDTVTVGAISVAATSSTTRVFTGSGVTMSSFTQNNGTNEIHAAATVAQVTCIDGTLTIDGEFTVTALDVEGGTCYPNNTKSGGSAVTRMAIKGGTVNAMTSNQARTWDWVWRDAGADLTYDTDIITLTNPLVEGD